MFEDEYDLAMAVIEAIGMILNIVLFIYVRLLIAPHRKLLLRESPQKPICLLNYKKP